jgi:hypothetical protein
MTAPPSGAAARDTIPELSAAGRRAVDWLLGQLNPDGSLGRVEDGFKYYRAPWTFALYGESDAGHAICGWIRANLLTTGPSGRRLAGPLRILRDGYAYRDSGLMIGAQMLHQHDLSIGLVPELLRSQDSVSGGFANDLRPDGPAGGAQESALSDEMDIPYACGPGFACLLTGRIAEARRVAEFLQTIYDAQTELPERFFCFWSRSRQAPIRYGDQGFQQRYVVENQQDRMQRWTIGGIAAAFLCRLYLADPQEQYLALARQYQAFSMAATDAQFSYPSACKSSWGAALLYQITGESQYLDWLGRFARWYIDSQEPAGYWHPWVENTLGDIIEITLEYAMHISTLTGAVSSRPATSVSAD